MVLSLADQGRSLSFQEQLQAAVGGDESNVRHGQGD